MSFIHILSSLVIINFLCHFLSFLLADSHIFSQKDSVRPQDLARNAQGKLVFLSSFHPFSLMRLAQYNYMHYALHEIYISTEKITWAKCVCSCMKYEYVEIVGQ